MEFSEESQRTTRVPYTRFVDTAMELSPGVKALAGFTDFLWRNRIVLAMLAVVAACFVAFGLVHAANAQVYSAMLIGYIVYYFAYVVHKPKLHASLSFRNFLLRYCPSTERSYFPTCFAFGGLAHSFSRALFHRFIDISYRRYHQKKRNDYSIIIYCL